jgi:D-glycero-D-manno-heptose 1,7-bisphosphate phosphatase
MSMAEEPMKRPFVFLDRDGTIIVDIPYLNDPDKIRFTDDAFAGLQTLRRLGYGLIMVTNQSGIGRGYLDEQRLTLIHERLKRLLAEQDIFLDAIYHCPHAPDAHCHCRKPATGMLEAACRDFAVDTARSFMIGDSPVDVNLGKNFGIKTIQIRSEGFTPAGADYEADTLLEAARLIASNSPL